MTDIAKTTPGASKELIAFREQFGPCEMCGGWATTAVWDLDETTQPGDATTTYKPRGKLHVFCDAHKRNEIVYPAPWREDQTPYEMPTVKFEPWEEDDMADELWEEEFMPWEADEDE